MEFPLQVNPTYRFQFLQLYEDFTKKSIPIELKHISTVIKKDLTKNGNQSFQKSYVFGFWKFNVDLIFNIGPKKSYGSYVNVYSLFFEPEKVPEIPVKVEDTTLDIDYVLSIITHELRHIYDTLTIINSSEIHSFHKELCLQKFKGTPYYKFTQIIYLSLEHELIARNNMLYPMFRWRGTVDKNRLMRLYYNSPMFKDLQIVKNFRADEFISLFKDYELIKYTNLFIQDVAKEQNLCKNQSDLVKYYQTWEKFFQAKVVEYSNYTNEMIDEVIHDIENDVVYEKVEYTYHEYEIDGIRKIFSYYYHKMFNISDQE